MVRVDLLFPTEAGSASLDVNFFEGGLTDLETVRLRLGVAFIWDLYFGRRQ
jgi:hypothetical protein